MGDIDTDIGGDRPERCVFIGLPPEPQDRRLEDLLALGCCGAGGGSGHEKLQISFAFLKCTNDIIIFGQRALR